MRNMRWIGLALALSAAAAARAEGTMDRTMAKLEASVEALRTTRDAWRRIPWRTCLFAAAREAREKGRPMLLWALGGDPSGRCWVFAGALREEVFSLAPVIRRIQDGFIPVAISVPRFLGDGAEARFYSSLTVQNVPPTSGSPIPQGVCAVTPGGTVLAWTQLFRDEKAVHGFLDEMLARFRAEKADDTPPAHAAGERCPGEPSTQRGSLAGVVYGRALDAGGQPYPDTDAQARYMQERIAVPRGAAEALASRLRAAAPGARVAVPDEVLRPLAKEMHLGMKDASLLANPVGAPEQLRRLELEVLVPAGAHASVMPLKGRFEARTERRPGLEHEQALDLEGALELDRQGIARLILLARGTFRLRWRGYDDDTARFRMLMAGRSVDQSGGIRYGVALSRADRGTDRDASDTNPVEAARIMLGQLASGGRDVARFRTRLDELAREFESVRAGKPESFLSGLTFPRRMEALLRELAAEIQGSMTGADASPIADLKRALGFLRSRGVDVTALERDLTELASEFEAIRAAGGPAERIARFRPRVESLAARIHERAIARGSGGAR